MNAIVAVRIERLRVPFLRAVRDGPRVVHAHELGLVRITTADGCVGVGEIAGAGLQGDLIRASTGLDAALLGRDPGDHDALGDVPAALLPATGGLRAGVETALLDLVGQARGVPIAVLLGAAARSVRVNGLLELGVPEDAAAAPTHDPAEAAAAAARLVTSGFDTIKVKRTPGADQVVEALRQIRDTVGGGVHLRLDLNGDLDEEAAIAWLRGLEWADLEYVEQPIAAELGPEALARVRGAIPMPVAADESVTDPDAALELVRAGACDTLVVKPARVGGPRRAHRIVRMAHEAGTGVTISTLYETGIGLAAAAHVAATVVDDAAHGLATGSLLADDLVPGALSIRDGRLDVPVGPGLGVAVDEAAVTRMRVA